MPQGAFQITQDGKGANLHASNVPVIDSFQFGGQVQVPAFVSYSMKWQASGPFENHGSGTIGDAAAFRGTFAPATVQGSFSGRELGFSFSGTGAVNSKVGGYALLGREKNGRLLS